MESEFSAEEILTRLGNKVTYDTYIHALETHFCSIITDLSENSEYFPSHSLPSRLWNLCKGEDSYRNPPYLFSVKKRSKNADMVGRIFSLGNPSVLKVYQRSPYLNLDILVMENDRNLERAIESLRISTGISVNTTFQI